MTDEMTFVIVTPHTIRKSRTGAILSRLLSQASAELIATQMFALSQADAEAYAATIRQVPCPDDEMHRRMIREYIIQNLSPAPDGRPHRCLLLVFRGENAFQEIHDITGHAYISSHSGETIRDTYGDLAYGSDGSVRYFEPAVLTPDRRDTVADDIGLWLRLAAKSPALLENSCFYANPDTVQKTLVLIKPDSWQQRSSRPGAVLDMFSRTGLRIIAAKLCRMTVAQALDFYGPVKQALRERLAPGIGLRARLILEKELGVSLPAGVETALGEVIGVPVAVDQFERIIEFMSGTRPRDCREDEFTSDGKVKSLALVYEGEHAIGKIRAVLGPTDPTKAPGGTVRREFGSDVMVNTAHASDSVENAAREMDILALKQSNLAVVVNRALRELNA